MVTVVVASQRKVQSKLGTWSSHHLSFAVFLFLCPAFEQQGLHLHIFVTVQHNTSRSSTNTAKPKIRQTTSYNANGLYFSYGKDSYKIPAGLPKWGCLKRWGKLKAAIFDQYLGVGVGGEH